ncbi:MAG: hypothetical protein ACE5EY_17985, partial [Anaerolineae bacterium]
MSRIPVYWKGLSRRKVLVGAMIAAGLAAAAWMMAARQYLEVQPTLPGTGLDRLEMNPYPIGVSVLS